MDGREGMRRDMDGREWTWTDVNGHGRTWTDTDGPDGLNDREDERPLDVTCRREVEGRIEEIASIETSRKAARQ